MQGSPNYNDLSAAYHFEEYRNGEFSRSIPFEPKETWPEYVDVTTIDDDRVYRILAGYK